MAKPSNAVSSASSWAVLPPHQSRHLALPGAGAGTLIPRPCGRCRGDSPKQPPLVLPLPGRHLLEDAPNLALVSLWETERTGRRWAQAPPLSLPQLGPSFQGVRCWRWTLV